MPKFGDIDLPTVTVSDHDCDKIAGQLANKNMPIEAMLEIAIYCKREREKGEALKVIEDVMRGRIEAIYSGLPEDQRTTRRTQVGMVTYTAAGEKRELIDRDAAIEQLTPEQIRITYKPDLKALETILKKDALERITKVVPTPARITVRDNPAGTAYDEIDF